MTPGNNINNPPTPDDEDEIRRRLEELEERKRIQREEDEQDLRDLEASGAPIDIINAQRRRMGLPEQGAEKSPEEIAVDAARRRYVTELLRVSEIKKTRRNIFTILGSKTKKENLAREEEFYTEELKRLKAEYAQARITMGNAMYDKEKARLVGEGLSANEVEGELTVYKAKEILQRIVIDEAQKVIDEKGTPLWKRVGKKVHGAYMNIQPPWKRRAMAISIALLPAIYGAAAAGTVAALMSVGSLAAVKVGRSMGSGVLIGASTKGFDFLNRGFEERQEREYTDLKNQFALGEINLEELEKYEMRSRLLDKETEKRRRAMMVLKVSTGILVSGGVSALLNGEVHNLSHIAGSGTPKIESVAPKLPDTSANIHSSMPVDSAQLKMTHDSTLARHQDTIQKSAIHGTHQTEHPVKAPTEVKRVDVEKQTTEHSAKTGTEDTAIKHHHLKTHHAEKTQTQIEKEEQLKKLQEKLEGKSGAVSSTGHRYDFDKSAGDAYFKATGEQPTYQIDDNGDIRMLGSSQIIGHDHGDISLNDDGSLKFLKGEPAPLPDHAVLHAPGQHTDQALRDRQVDPTNVNNNPPPGGDPDNAHVDEYGDDPSNPQLASLQSHLEGGKGVSVDDQPVNSPDDITETNPDGFQHVESMGAIDNHPLGVNPNGTLVYSAPAGVSETDRLAALTPPPKEVIDSYQPPIIVNPTDHSIGGIGTGIHMDKEHIAVEQTAIRRIHELHNLRTHSDVIDRLGRRNIIIERPAHGTIQGVSYEEYNNTFDYETMHQAHIGFSSLHRHDQLLAESQLFGKARGGVFHNAALNRDMYVESPAWQSTSQIPAKYFLNKELMKELIPNLSPEQHTMLTEAGVLDKHDEFINQKELLQWQKTYAQFDRFRAVPDDNESIQHYIARLTSSVHQAKDGTLYMAKPGTDIDELLQPRPEGTADGSIVYADRYNGGEFRRVPMVREYYVAGRASRRIIEDVVGRRWGR